MLVVNGDILGFSYTGVMIDIGLESIKRCKLYAFVYAFLLCSLPTLLLTFMLPNVSIHQLQCFEGMGRGMVR